MKRVLVLVDELYEDLELWYPRLRLQENGIGTLVAGPKSGVQFHGKYGYPCRADMEFLEAEEPDFDGILVPGGYAPDKLRRYEKVLELIQQFHQSRKCIGFICHGGSVLISAGVLSGRRATGTEAIRDDLINAGAIWENNEVVIDDNLISSRSPKDLPYFAKAMIKYIERK